MTVALYSVVFGTIFGSIAPKGDPSGLEAFSLYLLVAVIPWGFFATLTSMTTGAILGNSGLVRKVAFPRQALVISQVMFMFVQFTIEIALVALILLLAGSPALPWLPVVLVLMFLLACFAAGVGLVLGAATVYFRDLPYLWTIVTQVWFFLTPIVYTYESVEDKLNPALAKFIEWNPMTGFVTSFRRCLFDGTNPDVVLLAVLAAVSFTVLTAGAFVFAKLNRRLAEEA